MGRLAGSVRRVRNAGSQGCKFKPHVGCRDYLKQKKTNKTTKKKLKKKIKCEVFTPDSVHSDHSALVFAITEAFLEVYDFDPDS